MSLAEIVEAVKTLSHEAKVRLTQTLLDELGGTAVPATPTDREAELRRPFPVDGVASAGSQVTTDAAGFALLHEAIAGLKRSG